MRLDGLVEARTSIKALGAIGAAAVALAAAVCFFWNRGGESRPNVLLITIDTLRADRLGCYGYAPASTPYLDRLAREGALFENAFCDVTWTTPSLASTMTGTYAVTHGVKSTYQRLPESAVTLAELFRDSGYGTAAVVGSFPASSIFGLAQGFRDFNEDFNSPVVRGGKFEGVRVPLEFHERVEEQRLFLAKKAEGDAYRPDADVTRAALQWIERHHGQPFFLWVHYFGPHEKRDQGDDYFVAVNKGLAAYDHDVTEADRAVGQLMERLRSMGLLDRTVVVVHADHGQSLNEHHYFGHGRFLYDEVLRVPLIVRYPPRVPPGRRVRAFTRNIDIFPTILDLAGLPRFPGAEGRSLVRLLSGDSGPDPDAETYCETYLPATDLFADKVEENGSARKVGFRRLGIRTPQWLYVLNDPWPLLDLENQPPVNETDRQRFTTEELYDMGSDPHQLRNVASENPEVVRRMRSRVQSFQTRGQPVEHRELDPASRERLRSLGYLE